MAITNIRKKDLHQIHQKFDQQTNRRRLYLHSKLYQYFRGRNIYLKIDTNNGIIEVPVSISDELKDKTLPSIISKYIHELCDLNYMIQIVLN